MQAKKALGQHWLKDKFILDEIVDFADAGRGIVVLEIGPGKGALTDVLIERGAYVRALEIDNDSINYLRKKFGQNNEQFNLQKADIREYDLGQMPVDYQIVANIPYYLTANLMRKLVDTNNKPYSAVLLIQKEVAQRLNGKPGDLSLIAILVQSWYGVTLGIEVPPESFDPPPLVDSQVIKLELLGDPIVFDSWAEQNRRWESYVRVVLAGFSQPRKKLRTSFAAGMGMSKDEAQEVLKNALIDPNSRAQELSLQQWANLTITIDNNKQK